MTDPFSVGAGVIGVLSLGITVCQGLAAYYGPFTQFDSETKALVQKAEGLTSTLKQLEALLKRLWGPLSSPPDEVHLVTQRIKDCQVELEGLSHSLAKCRGCDATTVIKKSDWYYARKALYPFKRGTLISLTGTVSDLQKNLDTALLILNLALSKRLEDQATLTLSVSKSIAAGAADISTTLTRIEQGQQQIFQAIQSFQQAGVTNPRALPPATLRSLCDQQQIINRHYRSGIQSGHVAKTNSTSCTCPQETSQRWKFVPKVRSHRFGCPLYFQREATTIFHGRYVFCNRFLGFSIQFSMNAVSGAGGFTILPSFGFRRVVPNDAPAFRLIGDFTSMLTERSSGVSPDSVLLQLQCLFEKGEATPNDILSDGTNLLRYAMDILSSSSSDDRFYSIYFKIIEKLALVYRVPLNEGQNRYPRISTALDCLLRAKMPWPLPSRTLDDWATFTLKLLSNGGEITSLPINTSHSYCRAGRNMHTAIHHSLLPRVVNELYPQDLGLSEFDVALLRRSEEDLRRILGHHHTITDPVTVLLSLVEWPVGLEIVLKSPFISYYPAHGHALPMAVSSSQKESVGLLLAAGYLVCEESLELAARLPDRLGIFGMLMDRLVKQRRRLFAVARTRLNLSEHAIHADELSSKDLLIICDMLENLSSEIDAILEECFAVYDHVGYNCQAAELLYAAGFINVEEGSSPISALPTPHGDELCNYLDVCCWFQAKGASLYSQFPMKSGLPIHHIAKCVGEWLGEDLHHRSGQVHKMQKGASSCQRALLKDVLADTEHHDSCVCACSVGGCLPSTILIAEATRYSDSRSDHILPRLFGFFGSVALDGVKEMHNILAPVVLRLCTFELLEITHTCRYHKMGIDALTGRVTISDVPEIHSEQRHLINRLEELVLEFQDRYRELNVTLPEFLTGYWRERMDEVKAEEQVFDQEEAQRMREVGVIVEYPTSVSE